MNKRLIGLALAPLLAAPVVACSSGGSSGTADTQANTLGFNATCKLLFQVDNPITRNTDVFTTWAAAQADAGNINNTQIQGDTQGITYGNDGNPISPYEAVDLTINIPSSFGATPIGQPVIAIYNTQGQESYSVSSGAIDQTVASGASITFRGVVLNASASVNQSAADKTCSVVGDNLNNYQG